MRGADPKMKAGDGRSVPLLIQESKYRVTTKPYEYQQKIRAGPVEQGVVFSVKRLMKNGGQGRAKRFLDRTP